MSNYYLGCDVSKGYADFIILDSGKKIIEHVFQIDDTSEIIRVTLQAVHDLYEVKVGLEA